MKTKLIALLAALLIYATAAAQSRDMPVDNPPLTINANEVIEKFRSLPAGDYDIIIVGDLKDRLKWERTEDNELVCKPELRWTIPSDVFIHNLDMSKVSGIDTILAVNWIYQLNQDTAKTPTKAYVWELTLPDNIEYLSLESPMVFSFAATENSRKYKSENNFLMTKDGKTVLYYRIKGMKQKFVPEGVEVLPDNAINTHFYDNFSVKIRKYNRMKALAAFAAYVDSTGESTKKYATEELDPKEGIIDLVLPKSLRRLEKNSIQESETYKDNVRWQIKIPENVEYIHPSVVKYITEISPKNKFYTLENGILYDKKKTKVILGQKFEGALTLPKTVGEICDNAFDGNQKLTAITLPKGLKKIGYRAFCNSGIKEIKLPKGLKIIGEEAFYGTEMLNVNIPGTVKKISAYSFGGYWNHSGEDTIKIKLNPGTETIDSHAFHYNDSGFNMIVSVPSTVKYIGVCPLSIGNNIYFSFEDTYHWHFAFNESDWRRCTNGIPLSSIEQSDFAYQSLYSINNTEYDKISLDNAMLKLYTAVGIFFNMEREYFDDDEQLVNSEVIERLDYIYQPINMEDAATQPDNFIFQFSVDSTDDDEQPCKIKVQLVRPYFYKL